MWKLGENEFDPILLTPEILEKCGFSGNDKYGEWRLSELGITKISNGKYQLLNGEDMTAWSFEYEHLHQIQNLYFTINGNELTYQP